MDVLYGYLFSICLGRVCALGPSSCRLFVGVAEGHWDQQYFDAQTLVDTVHAAVNANVGDIYGAFLQGFGSFFAESAADPLVISLLTGVAKPDLLQLITTDSGPLITRASTRLASAFTQTWVATSDDDAGVLARAIVRLCLSYVSMPPEADLGAPPAGGGDVAADLARLMAPFAERHGVANVP